jgi:hypothetical protein
MITAWFAAQYQNILKWLGVAGAFLLAVGMVRKSGMDAEKVKVANDALRTTGEAANVRNTIHRDNVPATERLQQDWNRDK